MPAPCGALYWSRSSTQGSAPTCPERCPRPPSTARVSISCPHFDTRAILRLDEPMAGQRHDPLRLWALVPFADPAYRQNREKHRHHLAWDLPHPHRRRLPTDALHLESVERAARQAAGAVRRTPQAVVRHSRCPARVAAIVAHGSERRKRHRYLSKVDDEMSLRGPSRCELPLLYRRCWSVLRKAPSSAAPSAVPPIRAARSGEGA